MGISTREVLRHQDIEDAFAIEQYRICRGIVSPSNLDVYLLQRRVEDLREWAAAEPWSYEVQRDLAEAKRQLAAAEEAGR